VTFGIGKAAEVGDQFRFVTKVFLQIMDLQTTLRPQQDQPAEKGENRNAQHLSFPEMDRPKTGAFVNEGRREKDSRKNEKVSRIIEEQEYAIHQATGWQRGKDPYRMHVKNRRGVNLSLVLAAERRPATHEPRKTDPLPVYTQKLAVFPERLEREVIAGLLRKDMHHDIEGVHDGPPGLIPRSAQANLFPGIFKGVFRGRCEGLQVGTARSCDQNEIIRDRGNLPDVENPKIFAFVGVERIITTLEVGGDSSWAIRCRNGHKVN